MKQVYYLSINGCNVYESYSISELKKIAIAIEKTKEFNGEIVNELSIGMYSLTYIE